MRLYVFAYRGNTKLNNGALAICHPGSDFEPESSLVVLEIMDLPAVQLRQAGPRQKHSGMTDRICESMNNGLKAFVLI